MIEQLITAVRELRKLTCAYNANCLALDQPNLDGVTKFDLRERMPEQIKAIRDLEDRIDFLLAQLDQAPAQPQPGSEAALLAGHPEIPGVDG